MKKIFNSLPADWIYQLISMSMVTTSAFYIFQFTDEYKMVKEFWAMNEKFYIYTFLALQFIMKITFYWLLFGLVRKMLFTKIKRKVLGVVHEPKNRKDLKDLAEFKKIIAQAFGIPITLGWVDPNDLHEKIEMTEEEFEQTLKSMMKWFCAFIHLGFTSILIWQLNAYYIIPLLLVVLLAIVVFCYIATFLYGNIHLIEKFRVEIVNQNPLLENISALNSIQVNDQLNQR